MNGVEIKREVSHGCILSPILFDFYIDDIISALEAIRDHDIGNKIVFRRSTNFIKNEILYTYVKALESLTRMLNE